MSSNCLDTLSLYQSKAIGFHNLNIKSNIYYPISARSFQVITKQAIFRSPSVSAYNEWTVTANSANNNGRSVQF